jgi:hypothetical protein
MNRVFSPLMSIRLLATLGVFLWSAILYPDGALACSCMGGHSACGEVTLGTAVFTGRVLSVSPPFENRLNPASRTQADRVTRLYDQLDSGAVGQSLQSLKESFRELIPGLSPDQSRRLKEANSRQALLRLFDLVLGHGSYVTLEVKTVFTGGHDDDDKHPAGTAGAKDDDDDHKPGPKGTKAKDPKAKDTRAKDDDDDDLAAGKITAVWTPSFDCGVEFQVGETYLVYASMDEDTDMSETDICMGTRRLSDAGADLPHLSFVKANPEESGHLDGLVTSSVEVYANPPAGDRIPAPVASTLVELRSDDLARYAVTDKEGRFVFDGLSGGSYRIAAYAAEYPDPNQVVATPRELTIMPKACARYVLLAQPAAPHK